MGAQSKLDIIDMNNTVEAAYTQIEAAVEDLFCLDIAESAILLTVRIIYNDLEEAKEEEDKQCKAT